MLSKTQQLISEECKKIEKILLDKNRKYGDSAINPVRIFSKASPEEQLNVRLDDKLSRIASGQADDTEDPELDLIGYLILKRVLRRKERNDKALAVRKSTLPAIIGDTAIMDEFFKIIEDEYKKGFEKANGLQCPGWFHNKLICNFPPPTYYLH